VDLCRKEEKKIKNHGFPMRGILWNARGLNTLGRNLCFGNLIKLPTLLEFKKQKRIVFIQVS
jgi:hypothetical protein